MHDATVPPPHGGGTVLNCPGDGGRTHGKSGVGRAGGSHPFRMLIPAVVRGWWAPHHSR